MKEQFIPYDEALSLKGLGFYEECFGWYTKENDLYLCEDGKLENNNNYDFIDWDKFYSEGISNALELKELFRNSCSAPVWQQALKWFLVKYNLFGSISVDVWHSKKVTWRICGGIPNEISPTDSDQLYDWDGETEFDTYEKAQLDCLKELIKIVKWNQKKL